MQNGKQDQWRRQQQQLEGNSNVLRGGTRTRTQVKACSLQHGLQHQLRPLVAGGGATR